MMADFLIKHYQQTIDRLEAENRWLRKSSNMYWDDEEARTPVIKLNYREMKLGALVRVSNDSLRFQWKVDAESLMPDGELRFGVLIDQSVLYQIDPTRYLDDLLQHAFDHIAREHAEKRM